MEYKGEGKPDFLIATDFPMQGSSRTQTLQIVGAARLLLDQQDWKAGDHKVALQVCDDSTAQAAKWDPDKCSRNAHAYAQDESLIGVIGTFNSGCAAIEIPVLCLRGEQSDLVLPDAAEEMMRRGPGLRGLTQVVEVPGCGHAPALNVPDQLDLVTSFIEQQESVQLR